MRFVVFGFAVVFCLTLISTGSFAQHSYKDNPGSTTSTRLDDTASAAPSWIDILGPSLDSIHHVAMQMHDSLVKIKFEVIKRSVDSIKKEVKRLKDSLNYEGGGNLGELFNKFDFKGLIGDSLLSSMKSFPNDIQGYLKNMPQIPPFELLPPVQKKKQTPVPNFKGWHYEALAEL